MTDYLLENQTTNGSGEVKRIRGVRTVTVFGTPDGATVTIEISNDAGVNWVSTGTDGEFTTAGSTNVYGFGSIRATVSGAGASTDLSSAVSS